ncbi:MAG: dihydroorotate dehydrogenase electron transfer subunit [Candidatus Porifericomitaceae bacterium WSBS_2022_MAG_OTU9]
MNTANIYSLDGVLLHKDHLGDQQYLLRIAAPEIAARAKPGQFVHLQCDPRLPMRRPMSIMRADAHGGWVEIMFRIVGEGTRLLAARVVDDVIPTIGPAGHGFRLQKYRPYPLLIGGGIGIPPILFLALHMGRLPGLRPLVLAGSESCFPFRIEPSRSMIHDLPPELTAAISMLEGQGIASRLASGGERAGCHHGHVTELARHWLQSVDAETLGQTEIFACGPEPMLAAIAELVHEFKLPSQFSVEEFMACAVGGCAGCAINIHTENGAKMQRVCIEGPVFEGLQLYPAL